MILNIKQAYEICESIKSINIDIGIQYEKKLANKFIPKEKALKSKEMQNEWWKTLKKGDIVRCIVSKNKTYRKIGDEFVIWKDYDKNYPYISYDYIRSSSNFDEFELVRRANEVKEEVPEYYECINRGYASFTVGKIYKIRNPLNLEDDGNFIDDSGRCNGWCGYNYEHFKPSTKSAYDAQFRTDVPNSDIDYIDIMCKKDCLSVNSPKKKSYTPIYTEPTTVTNVDELILIKKVNKVKTIKI